MDLLTATHSCGLVSKPYTFLLNSAKTYTHFLWHIILPNFLLIKPPGELPVNYVPMMNALGRLKAFKHF